MDLEVSSDPSRLDMEVIHEFLAASYWSPGIEREKVECAIANSLCWGLYAEGRQIGFARVVTDQASFAYLADVFVLPRFQGQGLGERLIRAVLDDERLQGLRRFMLATRDAHGLYRKFGFETPSDPSRLMVRQSAKPTD